tara:strand:- start:432 stop:818 length:387 start_codon:yes stop_codon:yes gene_type:complete
MARYASGKYAYGISDRSGFRYRLSEMVTEWNGLKVGPDEYEAKHPQLEPISPGSDPQALFDPRPDRNENENTTITFPIFSLTEIKYVETPLNRGFVGRVTVEATENLSLTLTGQEITGSVGSVVVVTA